MVPEQMREWVVCPACKGPLEWEETRVKCSACGRDYPVVDGIAVLLEEERAKR
jgi:uncharacterized protein YbaR (Trm112 family)